MTTFSHDPFWLQTNSWGNFPGLIHGFSSRMLDHEAALVKLGAPDFQLYTLKQVHGDRIITITQQSATTAKPEADGLVSAEPGVLLGIATADCVPVLIAAPEKKIAAALHAGWRGTLQGISRRAIEELHSRWNISPGELYVSLGPAIGGCCYEVGPEVGEAIVSQWRIQSSSAWRPFGAKGFLDLREVNSLQIAAAGVPKTHIAITGPCTFCDLHFASYRREGASAGRQLSVIGWQKL
ncbi:MAG TPA: peptidoglycan editing factor PgeF [Methylomirabilota bacterium]|nr:peptidoglycan editing factor PgeF [Methylomirabilota bacterium]